MLWVARHAMDVGCKYKLHHKQSFFNFSQLRNEKTANEMGVGTRVSESPVRDGPTRLKHAHGAFSLAPKGES